MEINDIKNELDRLKYKRKLNNITKNILYILMAISAAAVLIAVIFLPVLRIYGHSMDKTMNEGDIVLSVKNVKVEKGEILAFYYNNKVLVKRVIASGGDWVNIDHLGNVYVNQKKLEEDYVTKKTLGKNEVKYPFQVPDNELFVLGDNREESIDSRMNAIGTIKSDQIVGKIVFRIYPFKNIQKIK